MSDGSDCPFGFASCISEKGYSQIEKEGLLCVRNKKFHNYLYEHLLTLITDHKPLLGLLKKHQATPSNAYERFQRVVYTFRTGPNGPDRTEGIKFGPDRTISYDCACAFSSARWCEHV